MQVPVLRISAVTWKHLLQFSDNLPTGKWDLCLLFQNLGWLLWLTLNSWPRASHGGSFWGWILESKDTGTVLAGTFALGIRSCPMSSHSTLKLPCCKETQIIVKFTKQWYTGVSLLYAIIHMEKWHAEAWRWHEEGKMTVQLLSPPHSTSTCCLTTNTWASLSHNCPAEPFLISDPEKQWQVLKWLLSF